MKLMKVFTVIFIATAMTAFVAGCSDDDDVNESVESPVVGSISVSPASLAFVVEGEAKTVTVTANASWTADFPDWVEITPPHRLG